jgi:type 1 glutamine amidotransferase
VRPRALFLIKGSHSTFEGNATAELVRILRQGAQLELTVSDTYDELQPERLDQFDLVVNWSGYKSEEEPSDEALSHLLNAVSQGLPYVGLHGSVLPFARMLEARQAVQQVDASAPPETLLNAVQVRVLEMTSSIGLSWPDKAQTERLLTPAQSAFLRMSGSAFVTHGPVEEFHVHIVDAEHPIARGVEGFVTTDELYLLGGIPQDIHVVAEVGSQPIVYTKSWGLGPVYYNALGHNRRAVQNPSFEKLLVQGVQWALESTAL